MAPTIFQKITKPKDKRSGLALVLGSSLIVLGASTLAFGGIVVEQPLAVYNTGGQNPGSVPASSYATAGIFILVALALALGLIVFGFAREAYRRVKTKKQDEPSLPSTEIKPVTRIDEWEEAPKKKEDEYS